MPEIGSLFDPLSKEQTNRYLALHLTPGAINDLYLSLGEAVYADYFKMQFLPGRDAYTAKAARIMACVQTIADTLNNSLVNDLPVNPGLARLYRNFYSEARAAIVPMMLGGSFPSLPSLLLEPSNRRAMLFLRRLTSDEIPVTDVEVTVGQLDIVSRVVLDDFRLSSGRGQRERSISLLNAFIDDVDRAQLGLPVCRNTRLLVQSAHFMMNRER